jgi:hypothetical protein
MGRTFFVRIKSIRNSFKICYQNGLKAFGKYSTKIELSDTTKCEGSVEIDECIKHIYPQENRWDYVFSYKGNVYFVEVHSADTSEVKVVLKKLQWLKDWLNCKAPELDKLKAKSKTFTWIMTNGNHILAKSSQSRELAQKGLMPISKLKLQ